MGVAGWRLLRQEPPLPPMWSASPPTTIRHDPRRLCKAAAEVGAVVTGANASDQMTRRCFALQDRVTVEAFSAGCRQARCSNVWVNWATTPSCSRPVTSRMVRAEVSSRVKPPGSWRPPRPPQYLGLSTLSSVPASSAAGMRTIGPWARGVAVSRMLKGEIRPRCTCLRPCPHQPCARVQARGAVVSADPAPLGGQ